MQSRHVLKNSSDSSDCSTRWWDFVQTADRTSFPNRATLILTSKKSHLWEIPFEKIKSTWWEMLWLHSNCPIFWHLDILFSKPQDSEAAAEEEKEASSDSQIIWCFFFFWGGVGRKCETYHKLKKNICLIFRWTSLDLCCKKNEGSEKHYREEMATVVFTVFFIVLKGGVTWCNE